MKFNYNNQYINNNKLNREKIKRAKIELVAEDEIFVKHPDWNDYFISQYGRGISVKNDKLRLLSLTPGGGGYFYFKFSEWGNDIAEQSISVQRAVADIFCPNYWGNIRLQAHHMDKNRINNNYWNLVLLPINLHKAIHKIKKMVLLKDGKIIEIRNVLELAEMTGLTLEEIILVNKDSKKKPLKSNGGYSVFDIKGNLIGYQFYPEK